MKLTRYHKKRNFKKTSEPKGYVKSSKTKRLYIIQKHAASHLHYDLRLELGGTLLSWAVPKGPSLDPTVKRLAIHVEDHPVSYASFEGTIPKGQYGGGTVMLWDKGTWQCQDKNPLEAYRKGDLKFTLYGKKLKGAWKLIRINKDDKTWLLMKVNDDYAKPIKKYDITQEELNSVKTGRTMDEISQKKTSKELKNKKSIQKSILAMAKGLVEKPFPKMINPELATLVDKPPSGSDWLHEIKLDGYRIIACKNKNKTKLYTGNNNDWTNKFVNIAADVDKLPIETAIFDGEVVMLDDKQHASFQLLQNSIKEGKAEFIYYIFDLLYLDKYDLTNLPLLQRKKILKDILPAKDFTLRFSDYIIGSGEKLFKKACSMGLEGIVSKNIDSLYVQKRTKEWLKVKCVKQQEFVIGGFTAPKNKRQFFGSLLLGTYNKQHELIYHGNVGTGFTQQSLETIHKELKKRITKKNPFKNKSGFSGKITWIKPTLIAAVEFIEWTDSGSLRHPSFQGLRMDKSAKAVTKEEILPVQIISSGGDEMNKIKKKNNSRPTRMRGIEPHFSHLDKILYPEDKITKEDLINYYLDIKDWILPYIIKRPLTLVRCPGGYKHCFFQKHLNAAEIEGILTLPIKEKDAEVKDYLYITDETGLLMLPQINTLEIHPWESTISKLEYPDQIIFDLDPAPNVAWQRVVDASFELKKYLAKIKLKSFVRSTGGKGLHVVIPIQPEYDWEEVKIFAKTLVEFMVMENPNKYISKMQKKARRGKIFIDYLRNQRGATAIASYSTRARKYAPIATPLHWDELTNDMRDTFFTIKTIRERLDNLKQDPWKDFFKLKQSLNLKKYR